MTGTVIAFPPKYAAETVVYLKDAPPPKTPRRHRVQQKGMTFLPHVLAVAVRDSVTFMNDDGVDHNVFSPDGQAYNLGVFSKGEISRARLCQGGGVHPAVLHASRDALVHLRRHDCLLGGGRQGRQVQHPRRTAGHLEDRHLEPAAGG